MVGRRIRRTVAGHINDDVSFPEIAHIEHIMATIFTKLPVDSLVSYKQVCRQWYELITKPHFTHLQFNYSRENHKLILYMKSIKSISIDLHLLDKDGHIRPYTTLARLGENVINIVSFFNGLMCCTTLRIRRTFVINPATHKILAIPDASPTRMIETLGVVFDVEPAKYKVVRFYSWKYFRPAVHGYSCEVYCPERQSWTQVGTDLPCPLRNAPGILLPPHLSVGGMMYWFVWRDEPLSKVDHMLSIGMDEIIRRVELPPLTDDAPGYLFDEFTYLFNYKGSLGLFYVEKEEEFGGIYKLVDPEASEWKLVGFTSFWLREITGINSIVEIGDELLFVLKQWDGYFHFWYLNLDTMLWREPETSFLRRGGFRPRLVFQEHGEALVFPFCESSFKCRGE